MTAWQCTYSLPSFRLLFHLQHPPQHHLRVEKKVGEKIRDFVIDEFLGKRRRAEEEQRSLPVLIEVVEDVSHESEQISESRHVVSSALQQKCKIGSRWEMFLWSIL